MVINFDLPASPENYLHRIGRSRQIGLSGLAINFVTATSVSALREIEAYYQMQIEEMPMDIAHFLQI